MERNYNESLRRLLLSEGGYTNEKTDPGGPTNFGITIFDYRLYIDPNGTADDVFNMSAADAKAIYRRRYWDSQQCTLLPDGLDYTIFDYGVNSGIGRSQKVLQRCLHMNAVDGQIGPSTLATCKTVDLKALIEAVNDERLAFLRSLKHWPTYKNGWSRRVAEVRETSLRWADQPAVATRPMEPAPIPSPQAKGVHPAPTGTGKVIVGGATGGAGAAAATWTDWIAAHPWQTGLGVGVGLLGIGGALYALNQWHQARQEASPPGWKPPELPKNAA